MQKCTDKSHNNQRTQKEGISQDLIILNIKTLKKKEKHLSDNGYQHFWQLEQFKGFWKETERI